MAVGCLNTPMQPDEFLIRLSPLRYVLTGCVLRVSLVFVFRLSLLRSLPYLSQKCWTIGPLIPAAILQVTGFVVRNLPFFAQLSLGLQPSTVPARAIDHNKKWRTPSTQRRREKRPAGLAIHNHNMITQMKDIEPFQGRHSFACKIHPVPVTTSSAPARVSPSTEYRVLLNHNHHHVLSCSPSQLHRTY